MALSRREESPLIGDLEILTKEEVAQQFPGLKGFEKLLYASGGAHVEGALLTETLLKASGARVIKKEVALSVSDDGYQIAGESYDQVILATGAWLGQVLEPLGYQVDVRPQKGQLRDYQLDLVTDDYPWSCQKESWISFPSKMERSVWEPPNENESGLDLMVDQALLNQMETEALSYYPELSQAEVIGERVGTVPTPVTFHPFGELFLIKQASMSLVDLVRLASQQVPLLVGIWPN